MRGLTAAPTATGTPARSGVIGDLDRIAGLGFTVVELLPVHQSDPQEGSYWGYMPLAFGAVEQRYASGDHAAASSPSRSPPPTSAT